jgi:hypothetical protein
MIAAARAAVLKCNHVQYVSEFRLDPAFAQARVVS